MNILLVEDDPLKSSKILGFLHQRYVAHVVHCGSYQSGLKMAQESKPELILLDMTLPTFDRNAETREGRNRPLGGYDLMRKMRLKTLNAMTIVVTQLDSFGEGDNIVTFKEITERCASEFAATFLGSVHFQQDSDDWQEKLAQLINSGKFNA